MVKKVNISSFFSSIRKTFSPKNTQEIKPMKFIDEADEYVPNFIQRDNDHLGITGGRFKFSPEDTAKMDKMSKEESALYRKKLIREKKYIDE